MQTTTQDRLASTLVQQANRLLASGRFDAARTVVAALRHSTAAAPDADQIEARLCMAEGHLPDAIRLLDCAIGRTPASPALHLLRAEARSRLDDHSGAAADAAEATVLAPEDSRARAMLGLIMIELGHLPDAVACLHDAVQRTPTLAAAWRGLAEAMTRLGDSPAAAAVHDAAIANLPHDAALRLAAMMTAMRERNFDRALALGLSARQYGLADACIFGLLGHACSKLGRHAEAAEHYQDALRLAPEDPYVRHLVRAAGMLPGADHAPLPYLETVFDGYADTFDQHLASLGYRVPGTIRDALDRMIEQGHITTLGDVLDLGCGTGLVGSFIADLPLSSLTGVDISENMVAKARAKALYQTLAVADIGTFLDSTPARWNLVLAGDVLCYRGALDSVFASAAAALRPGGWLICNVEHDPSTGDPGWRLEAQGRYVHSAAYVRARLADAGLRTVELRPETLRYEACAPVNGLLITARKGPVNG